MSKSKACSSSSWLMMRRRRLREEVTHGHDNGGKNLFAVFGLLVFLRLQTKPELQVRELHAEMTVHCETLHSKDSLANSGSLKDDLAPSLGVGTHPRAPP